MGGEERKGERDDGIAGGYGLIEQKRLRYEQCLRTLSILDTQVGVSGKESCLRYCIMVTKELALVALLSSPCDRLSVIPN